MFHFPVFWTTLKSSRVTVKSSRLPFEDDKATAFEEFLARFSFKNTRYFQFFTSPNARLGHHLMAKSPHLAQILS